MTETITFETSLGTIIGLKNDTHLEFRGIPYAKAGRFEYPTPIECWTESLNATEFGDCCFQRRSFEEDAVCNPFYHKEFREGQSFTYSENCQYLNLYVPIPSKDENLENRNLPVLVYIHGGSFTGGSSNENHIDGANFAQNGVLFVAFNYRLGPFGFCSHPDLRDEQGRCGNYGLYDQLEALKWIKHHISDFGGDSENITLMGQSAGAMSVDIHSTSPLEKDWYARFLLSSGAGLQRFLLRPAKPEQTKEFWNTICAEAKVETVKELKTVDPKTLYYAWLTVSKQFSRHPSFTLPVFDGQLLEEEHFSKKELPVQSCVVGITKNDMMPPLLRIARYLWAKQSAKLQHKHNPFSHADREIRPILMHTCFQYDFNRKLPGDNKGAWHSSDLLYFFSTLSRNYRPFEKKDYELSKEMSGELIAYCNGKRAFETRTNKGYQHKVFL